MADKSPAGYLPETSQEAIDLNRAQQEALARLNEALDVRKNRIMDPRWAAAAEGFWKPTRTGHWSEAAANVIGNVSKADEAMALEEQNIAKAKFDIASQGIAMQRQKDRDRIYRQRMGIQEPSGALPSAAPSGPQDGVLPGALNPPSAKSVAPSGPPSGALPAPISPQGGAMPKMPFGIQIAPPRPGLTKDQFYAGAEQSGMSPEEADKQWEEIDRKANPFNEKGSFDSRTGIFYPNPGAGTEERKVQFPDGTRGTIKFPVFIANLFDNALLYGDMDMVNRLVNQFAAFGQGGVGLPSGQSPISVPDSSGAPPKAATATPSIAGSTNIGKTTNIPKNRPLTLEEERALDDQRKADLAVSQARRIATAQEEVKQEGEEIKDIRTAGKDAIGTIAFTKTIRTLANGKQAEKIFGVLTTPNLLDNVANILDKGVMGVRIQGLEDAIRNSGLDEDGIAQARVAAGQFNQLQIRMAAAAKGAVSDYERQLFADAAINLKDPVKAVHMKNDMLEAKAVFDRNIAKAFRQSKMGVEDFRDSEAFVREYQIYIKRLQGIASGQRLTETPMTAKPPAKPSAKPQQLHPSENSRRLDEALRN
jgi:hypothetical protein